MKWNLDIEHKFQRIQEDIPDDFKLIATQMIQLKAEDNARTRGGPEVEEVDLMDAFLALTPNSFRPLMFDSIKRNGIDLEKYTEDVDITDAWKEIPKYLHKNTLHLLCNSFFFRIVIGSDTYSINSCN